MHDSESISKTIVSRHCTRSFSSRAIREETLEKLLFAATCAPSGNNLQPWEFAIIREREWILALAKGMRKSRFIETAPCIIAVYKAEERCYARSKDDMAIGAAVQNLLLCAEENGLGACWIGEKTEEAEQMLAKVFDSEGRTLMALIAIGYRESVLLEDVRPYAPRRPAILLKRRNNDEK